MHRQTSTISLTAGGGLGERFLQRPPDYTRLTALTRINVQMPVDDLQGAGDLLFTPCLQYWLQGLLEVKFSTCRTVICLLVNLALRMSMLSTQKHSSNFLSKLMPTSGPSPNAGPERVPKHGGPAG